MIGLFTPPKKKKTKTEEIKINEAPFKVDYEVDKDCFTIAMEPTIKDYSNKKFGLTENELIKPFNYGKIKKAREPCPTRIFVPMIKYCNGDKY